MTTPKTPDPKTPDPTFILKSGIPAWAVILALAAGLALGAAALYLFTEHVPAAEGSDHA